MQHGAFELDQGAFPVLDCNVNNLRELQVAFTGLHRLQSFSEVVVR